ncbi:Cyclic di-GMP phosphodiesterase [uncultured bacterium]|nr:Cyclic di-GMP phosphodiesterase [uncultured bacterium]
MKTNGQPAGMDLLRKKLRIMELEVEVYREMGGLAVKGASRSALFNRLLEFALKAVDASSGALYSVDSNGALFPDAVKGADGLKDKALASLAVKSEKARIRKGVQRGGRTPSREAEASGLAVPLVRDKKVSGAITASGAKGRTPFTDADLKVFASLANHLSIIMERAELISSLDNRISQLSSLNEVGALLSSSLDHNVVRHRAMEAITKLMRAETGSLLLLDRENGELYFEVALGEKGKKLKEVRLKVGEGIAGWVAKHSEPVVIHDVTRDARFQGSVDKRSKFRTRNMVCVPVVIKGQVIGVLQAINRIGGEFTAGDLKLFQLFSNQAAIALDNARLYEEIKEAFYATSSALAEAIEKRDPYTGGHTKRVLAYCMAIADQLDMKDEDVEVLRLSAVLHDIGKIGVEDRILRKEAPFDAAEAKSMRMHPQFGAEILQHIPHLKDIMPGMLHHHERVDGLGYPSGLKEEEIPLTARIISVADAYDAMTSTRPYRKGLPPKEALAEIKRCAGRQFDIKVVNAFMKAFKKGEIDRTARRKSSGGAAAARNYDLV